MGEIYLGTHYNEILHRDVNDPKVSSRMGNFGEKTAVKFIQVVDEENIFYGST